MKQANERLLAVKTSQYKKNRDSLCIVTFHLIEWLGLRILWLHHIFPSVIGEVCRIALKDRSRERASQHDAHVIKLDSRAHVVRKHSEENSARLCYSHAESTASEGERVL